jgi:hypothetical protein
VARLGRAQPFKPIIKTQAFLQDGVWWGEQFPVEQPVTWQRWESAPGVPLTTTGDSAWGKAVVEDGTPIVGHVVDTGDESTKTFTVTRDKYGTGSGNITISIRGSNALFGQHDGSPSWATYSGPTSQAWRYVQIKMEYAA